MRVYFISRVYSMHIKHMKYSQNQTTPIHGIIVCDSCFVLGFHRGVKNLLSDFIYQLYFSVHENFSFFTLLNTLSLSTFVSSKCSAERKTLLKFVKYPAKHSHSSDGLIPFSLEQTEFGDYCFILLLFLYFHSWLLL